MGTDRAVDSSTSEGRTVSGISSTMTSLYIYCRNLDLHSKSLKPSGPHEPAARTYTHWNSPAQCGCSEIHLEKKDAHSQGQREIVRAQRKRTFPNHAQPGWRGERWREEEHISLTFLTWYQEAGTCSSQESLVQCHYLLY